MEDQVQQGDVKPKPTVVGIGASAGGLSALRQLFEHIPADSGIAFVVVVHLSPEHKSLLADLLQPCVSFPVQQVTETIPLEANNVYVIPPNANISAIDTHLRLSALEEKRRERAPIDHFFRTLAATHDGHSIGVVLTGTGSDGTLGLREIKAKGGLILVQDPNQAEFDGMPQSAISTGMVDRILPIEEIATALVRLAQSERNIEVLKHPDGSPEADRLLLPKMLTILRARTDRDFSRYKTSTLLRRIGRRMQLNYVDSFAQYLELVREQPEETRALADDLLINVTSFFRDTEVFDKLQKDIIPKLFENKNAIDYVRVWSVGCATGEEAYSLAMLLLEERGRRIDSPKIQIFASDLHKRSLEGAREGLYPGDIETDVSAARLQRFFQKENGGYRICKEVRDLVVFAPHNLLGDPPFSRLDLIACRNLLIYLDRSVQRDVIDLFHYALCPHGYLLLGSAETADASELFRTDDKKLCIYEKRNVPAPEPRLPVFPLTRIRRPGERLGRSEASPSAAPFQSVHQNLLERFAPPSVLVGLDNRLVHLSEHAGRYLSLPGGEVTASVLRLVREELRIELQSLLQVARDTKSPVDSAAIPVRFNEQSAPVVMHVRPAPDLDQEDFILVIFEEHQMIKMDVAGEAPRFAEAGPPGDAEAQIVGLEKALLESRQQLQTIIEEYETSQEEMKAANEEMQSTNEELRSTMEELETSKEELQSINEELQTVNQENRHKVEELSHLSGDLQNLLASTDIATLFLDRDLRILRFTPRLSDIFNVRVTDRGRPISDLTNRLGYPGLREDARAVLDRLVPIEREIADDRQRWYLTRMLPYRSMEDRIEGIVVTFTDITQRKQAEQALQESESWLTAQSAAFQEHLTGASLEVSLEVLRKAAKAYFGKDVRCAFYLGDPAKRNLSLVSGMSEDSGRSIDNFRIADDSLACGLATFRGEPVITSDVQTDERWKDWRGLAEKYDYRGCWSFPLRSSLRQVLGTIALYFKEPREATARDREAAELLARAATVIISSSQEKEEKARVEVALRESESEFRALSDAIPALTWRNDADGDNVFVNRHFLEFSGMSAEEISAVGWQPFLHPDDADEYISAYLADVRAHRPHRGQGRYRRYDGVWRYHEFQTQPIFAEAGTYLGDVGVALDVTDRKNAEIGLRESEERFRLYVENVREYALVQTDFRGVITSWNPGAERLFGFSSAEVIGQPFSMLLPEEDRHEGLIAREMETLSRGEKVVDAHAVQRKNGSRFWAEWVTEPVLDDSGKLRGTAKVMRDESERQQSDNALRGSLAEKEELLKEVHHRVKNNLQVIVSLLNMQSHQIHEEVVLSQFQEARNRVLAISSIHELLYRAESFAGIVLTDYARQLAPGLVSFYGLGSRVRLTVEGDGNKLELERAVPFGMLLNELVSNACKHAFPAPRIGTILIRVGVEDQTLVLTVADDGQGLPEGFEYQKATSLGLKLVHALARQLRGTVEVSSAQGTSICVRFPAADEGKNS